MKNKFLLGFISVCLSTSVVSAYTMQEAANKALNDNPEILKQRINQTGFGKYVDEAKAGYLPKIDITGRLEANHTKNNYKPGETAKDDSIKKSGYNIGIGLTQLIYDGKLTLSQIEKAYFSEKANKFKTNRAVDDVVYNVTKSYNGYTKYKELLDVTNKMLSLNGSNLETAKEKEVISGEILETYEAQSKLFYVQDNLLQQKDLLESNSDTFKRYVGYKPQGNECRIKIDLSLLPNNLIEAEKLAVSRNNEILEQIQRIKVQREEIAQKNSKFLPTITLELKAQRDDDLELNDRGAQEEAYGRINLAWNIYNGGATTALSEQAKIFLNEEKKSLDAITNKITERVRISYQRINKDKKRIQILKKYIKANRNIVKVYEEELKAGTRTFMDVLDAQMDLYESKQKLINKEYDLYENYYSLLNDFGMLSETISKTNFGCVKLDKFDFNDLKIDKSKNNNEVSSELKDLLEK